MDRKNMETGYCQLKQKEVVNVKDGKKLGRVCDVVFTFPEGKTLGVVVPGGKGFFRPNLFIPLGDIIKIGEDAVLVEVRSAPKEPPRGRGRGGYCTDDGPSRGGNVFPPPCPPRDPCSPCPPPRAPCGADE